MTAFTQKLPTPHAHAPQSVQLPFLNFRDLIQPISSLETELLKQPEFQLGYNWGVPRFGHPEGKVGFHVKEVLENIELIETDDQSFQRLRIAAIAHDTFKYQEAESKTTGKKVNHGLLARRFMEKFIDDETTLDLIELHDEIYYSWRYEALQNDRATSEKRLGKLLDRIGSHLKLHYLFFRCDTMTGDKIQSPRLWIENKIRESGNQEMVSVIIKLNGAE
ncbi:MAG: hypothetical protein AAFZ15_03865 [Bacteroidota bacterium]